MQGTEIQLQPTLRRQLGFMLVRPLILSCQDASLWQCVWRYLNFHSTVCRYNTCPGEAVFWILSLYSRFGGLDHNQSCLCYNQPETISPPSPNLSFSIQNSYCLLYPSHQMFSFQPLNAFSILKLIQESFRRVFHNLFLNSILFLY